MDEFLEYLVTFLNFFMIGGGLGLGCALGSYLVDLATGANKRRKEAVHRELARQYILERSLKVQESVAVNQARRDMDLT